MTVESLRDTEINAVLVNEFFKKNVLYIHSRQQNKIGFNRKTNCCQKTDVFVITH